MIEQAEEQTGTGTYTVNVRIEVKSHSTADAHAQIYPREVLHERLRQIYAEVKRTRRVDAAIKAAKELGVEL